MLWLKQRLVVVQDTLAHPLANTFIHTVHMCMTNTIVHSSSIHAVACPIGPSISPLLKWRNACCQDGHIHLKFIIPSPSKLLHLLSLRVSHKMDPGNQDMLHCKPNIPPPGEEGCPIWHVSQKLWMQVVPSKIDSSLSEAITIRTSLIDVWWAGI